MNIKTEFDRLLRLHMGPEDPAEDTKMVESRVEPKQQGPDPCAHHKEYVLFKNAPGIVEHLYELHQAEGNRKENK